MHATMCGTAAVSPATAYHSHGVAAAVVAAVGVLSVCARRLMACVFVIYVVPLVVAGRTLVAVVVPSTAAFAVTRPRTRAKCANEGQVFRSF